MKFLFDFFPVLLFFATFKSHEDQVEGMLTATAVLIAATLVQVAWTWAKHKKVEKMHVITLVLVVVLGGATIYFEEPRYLIWKVSVVNWLFALAFAGSHFIGDKPIIKRMMGHAISLPEPVWFRLSMAWICFFSFVGAINLVLWYFYFSPNLDLWVDFKFYGIIGLTLAFTILQAIYISRYVKDDPIADNMGNGDGE